MVENDKTDDFSFFFRPLSLAVLYSASNTGNSFLRAGLIAGGLVSPMRATFESGASVRIRRSTLPPRMAETP